MQKLSHLRFIHASAPVHVLHAQEDSDWDPSDSAAESSDDSSSGDSSDDSGAEDEVAEAAPSRSRARATGPRTGASVRDWENRAFAEAEKMIEAGQREWAKKAGDVPESVLHTVRAA